MTGKLDNYFKAHSGALTSLNFILIPQKMLLTTSHDKYIKIWRMTGECQAALNLNHALPTMWEVTLKKQKSAIKKALYALKILDIIS